MTNRQRPHGLRYVMPKVIDPNHHCHAQGCTKPVPPSMFMCVEHWKALPKSLRGAIWQSYRRGQEITKTPSDAYIAAAKEAIAWMAKHDGVQIAMKL